MAKEKITQSTTQSTAVSTEKQFTQSDIPALLETVNQRIKELTKNDSKTVTITQPLPGFTQIDKIEDVSTLLKACGSVEGKAASYAEMAKKHLPEGAKVPPFKIEGHSAEDWLDVIKSKMIEIIHKKDLDRLRSVKLTLESNLSQEMKLANDLKKINDLLNDE